MAPLSRRSFFKTSALAAALPLGVSAAQAAAAPPAPGSVDLSWLEGRPALVTGTTFGVPWPRGALRKDQTFVLSGDGGELPCQSWPLAYWPDGSLKWTAHALPAVDTAPERLRLRPGRSNAKPPRQLAIKEGLEAIVIDTGVIECTIPRQGADIVRSIRRGGRDIARAGKLVALSDDSPDGSTRQTAYESQLQRVTLEQRGPVRSVVKVEGMHRAQGGGRSWLPFTLRLRSPVSVSLAAGR